jgi:protein-S-isoprenylcysteine O-methyltransferase Ste14
MSFFDYFQIITLVVFYLVFTGRMLQLLVAGVNPFVIGSGKKGAGKILEACFMAGLLAWSLEVVVHAFDMDFHIFPDAVYGMFFDIPAVKSLGALVITAGFVVFVSSLIAFGRSWRIGIDTRNPGTLVTTGIFAVTRNPIFFFMDLYFIGTWLIYPNSFFGIAAALTIPGIHWQVLQEERFLSRQYGEEYRQYMKSVRRYI